MSKSEPMVVVPDLLLDAAMAESGGRRLVPESQHAAAVWGQGRLAPSRVRIARSRLACFRPIGRAGVGHRGTPDPLPSVEAEVERIRTMGVERCYLSEAYGLSGDGSGVYRFAERAICALSAENADRDLTAWADELILGLVEAGVTPVLYGGCPRTLSDAALARIVLDGYPARVEFCFDGAGGQGERSVCAQVARASRRTGRVHIEPLPWAGGEHWKSYPVFTLARTRVNDEFERGERGQDVLGGAKGTLSTDTADTPYETGPVPDRLMGPITIAMTGHRDRWGDVASWRRAQRWSRHGHTIAVQPWDFERVMDEVFEVEEETGGEAQGNRSPEAGSLRHGE